MTKKFIILFVLIASMFFMVSNHTTNIYADPFDVQSDDLPFPRP